MTSIKDVAKKAGVSTATVSQALNNHPSVIPEIRKTVHDVMDYLCYVPSKSAIQLSGKCSGLVVAVASNLVEPNFCELLATFEEDVRYISKSVIVKAHQNQPQQGLQNDPQQFFRTVHWINICGALTCTLFGAIDAIPRATEVYALE